MAPSFVLNVTRLWSFEPQDLAAIRVTQAVAQDVECPARQGGEDGRLLATRVSTCGQAGKRSLPGTHSAFRLNMACFGNLGVFAVAFGPDLVRELRVDA